MLDEYKEEGIPITCYYCKHLIDMHGKKCDEYFSLMIPKLFSKTKYSGFLFCHCPLSKEEAKQAWRDIP